MKGGPSISTTKIAVAQIRADLDRIDKNVNVAIGTIRRAGAQNEVSLFEDRRPASYQGITSPAGDGGFATTS